MLPSYFEEALRAFLEAEKNTNAIEQFYNIAQHPVRLRFAGQQLKDSLSPALNHLAAAPVSDGAFTVCLWDSASTKTMLPPFPWQENATIATTIKDPDEGTNPVIYFKDERIKGAYQTGTKTLSLLDTERDTAIFWVPDASKIPYYEQSSPLRTIVQWWAKKYNLQLVHAGAVGNDKGGVLLAGESGSGKSTTALICMDSGLSYASDDYCLVGMDPQPQAHSVYCSAKIDREGVQRFPGFASVVENTEGIREEKAVLLLNKHCTKKIVKGFPIRAILVLKIVDGGKTKLIPASPRKGLMALAPSTIFQLRGAGQADLTFMAALSRRVPSFVLELGNDTSNIPNVILDLLSKD